MGIASVGQSDNSWRSSTEASLPEAHRTHEADPLRVGELGPVSILMLDHPTPERNAPYDGGSSRPLQ